MHNIHNLSLSEEPKLPTILLNLKKGHPNSLFASGLLQHSSLYSSASSLLSWNPFSFHVLPRQLTTSAAPPLPPSKLQEAQSNTSIILQTALPLDQSWAASIGDQNATEYVPSGTLFLLVYVVVCPLLKCKTKHKLKYHLQIFCSWSLLRGKYSSVVTTIT